MAFRHIGVSIGDQCLDHRHHLGDVIGGARRDGGGQAIQRRHVLIIDAGSLFGQFADRDAALGGAGVYFLLTPGDPAAAQARVVLAPGFGGVAGVF